MRVPSAGERVPSKSPTRAMPVALVAEQEFRVVPAAVLLADEIFDRHLHVVEEDLVHFLAAVDQSGSAAP